MIPVARTVVVVQVPAGGQVQYVWVEPLKCALKAKVPLKTANTAIADNMIFAFFIKEVLFRSKS